jgi:hypothetical protein
MNQQPSSRLVRSLSSSFSAAFRWRLVGASALAIAAAACSPANDEPPAGQSGSNSSGTSSGGGEGTSGSSNPGSGGSSSTTGTSTGGNGGSGDMGGSGGGGGAGGGGMMTMMGPACSTAMGMNGAGLAVKRPEIGTKKLGALAAPDAIRIDKNPMTGDLVYMNRAGKFWKVDPTSGASTPTETSYTGGGDHRGMTFGPDGSLYTLSHNGNGGVIIRKGTAGATRTWSTFLSSDGYPAGGTNFDHKFAGVIVSPDGMNVFFSSGSRSDHGEVEAGLREVPLTSAVFRVPASSNNLMLKNDDTALKPYLYADGTRNTFDMAFNADGELFGGDNGPDMDLPDEINWLQEGKNYGFPWRFGNVDSPALDPTYKPAGDTRLHTGFQAFDQNKWVYDPMMPPKPATPLTDPLVNHGPDLDHFRASASDTVEDASTKNMTLTGISGHRSPLGLAFDTKGTLCGDYYKAGFVLSYGALLDVLNDGGQDLALMNLTKVNGNYEMTMTVLVGGFTAPIDSVLVDNKLYVIENRYGGTPGSIYEITLPLPAK